MSRRAPIRQYRKEHFPEVCHRSVLTWIPVLLEVWISTVEDEVGCDVGSGGFGSMGVRALPYKDEYHWFLYYWRETLLWSVFYHGLH